MVNLSRFSSSLSDSNSDPRIHCRYDRLIKLQAQVEGFSLLPQLKAGSVLSGRHGSVFRGRGLNFEELRHYQLGDDIRNLDWKVTMRTGKPHVRSYTEEKDRHVIICVDQRSSMFFSSVEMMKSVVAAEIAALIGWRVLKDSDRIGMAVCGCEGINWVKSRRSQADWLQRLQVLTQANQALNVASHDQVAVSFANLLAMLARLKLKNTTLVILSDWAGATEQDISYLKYLQRHNDVLGILIADPLEKSLPCHSASDSHWVVGDGQFQLNITNSQQLSRVNQGLETQLLLKKEQLLKLMAVKSLPVIELDTNGQHIEQFKRAIAGGR